MYAEKVCRISPSMKDFAFSFFTILHSSGNAEKSGFDQCNKYLQIRGLRLNAVLYMCDASRFVLPM